MVTIPLPSPRRSTEHGFSLVELMIALGITTVILGATMAVLADATRAADAATLIAGLNGNLRSGMDLMVRDLTDAGQGLPSGRVIQIPSGDGAQALRLPGPPNSADLYAGPAFCPPPDQICAQITAIIPGPGRGPEVLAGQPTDTITMLAADSAFDQVGLADFSEKGSSITIDVAGADHVIGTDDDVTITDGGADDLHPGDLLMLTKGSSSALAQVSRVEGQAVFFEEGDSLLINQSGATQGTVLRLRNTDPIDAREPGFSTTATRIRMISYYLDVTTDPQHARLIRRIDNGDPTAFDNSSGTVVAFDIDNLSISYDMVDGATNRANVRMTADDLRGGGGCGKAACSPNQIRKINILLSGRSRRPARGTPQFFRTRLLTQVSLRSMAFRDLYR